MSEGSLEKRLADVQDQLARQKRRLNRGAVLTMVFGVLMLILMAGYFYYGYTTLDDFTQPEKIVQLGTSTLLGNLQESREFLDKSFDELLPELVPDVLGYARRALDTGSDQLTAYIPELRSGAENMVLEQMDKLMGGFSALVTEEQFTELCRANGPAMRQIFHEMEGEEASGRVVSDLEKVVDSQMQRSWREQMQVMYGTTTYMKEKLEKLSRGKDLNAEQTLERNILKIARALRLQVQDPDWSQIPEEKIEILPAHGIDEPEPKS